MKEAGNSEVRSDEAVDAGVPGMCRTQTGCAVSVPWCAWERGWQALQVVDYSAPRTRDNGLKIRVSVVRLRPLATMQGKIKHVASLTCAVSRV